MFRFALLIVLATLAETATAHGGGLDSYGCHHNRKAGGYHCHRGPLAGQAFASQNEMLAAMRSAGQSEQPAKVKATKPKPTK